MTSDTKEKKVKCVRTSKAGESTCSRDVKTHGFTYESQASGRHPRPFLKVKIQGGWGAGWAVLGHKEYESTHLGRNLGPEYRKFDC